MEISSKDSCRLDIEYLDWQKAKDIIFSINSELAEIIEAWKPGNNFGFYKASYTFGNLILDEGRLCRTVENGDTA